MGILSLTPAITRQCFIPGLLLALLCIFMTCGVVCAADASHPDLYPYPYQKNVVCYYQKWVCDDQGCRYVDAVCHPCSHPGNPDPACKATATAIPTSRVTDSPERTYPPDEPEFPWVVVIGVIGVLGIGAAVGAKVLGGKKPAPATAGKVREKEKKKEESVTYILQMSAIKLSVTAEQSASLTVAVWKKVGENPPVHEPGAVVTVGNPADSGLSVNPPTGNSPLQSEIKLAGEPKGPTVILGITATAGGTTKKAEVTVEISSKTRIEFE